MKKFAVIGNPINHSLSPIIHQLLAKSVNLNLKYEKILVDEDNFPKRIFELKNEYSGLNITLPFKQRIVDISNEKTLEVMLTGSANTISFENNLIKADNTDGYGLIKDLNDFGFDVKDSSILLIGAGGAANGVIYRILSQNPRAMYLHNRTIEKSMSMVTKWRNEYKSSIEIKLFSEDVKKNIDLIINATSSSLNSSISPINLSGFKKQALCYDMMYGKKTPFINCAIENNLKFLDGLGMLVNQAAESFRIWNNVKIDSLTIKKIKDELLY